MKQLQDVDWDHWIPAVHATLLFVVQDRRILLMRKKRGLGAGKINGPGGKLDSGEAPQVAAGDNARDVTEARISELGSNLLLKKLQKVSQNLSKLND